MPSGNNNKLSKVLFHDYLNGYGLRYQNVNQILQQKKKKTNDSLCFN